MTTASSNWIFKHCARMQNTLREFRGRIAIGNADLICNTTYSEDSIYKGRNCNLKLKSSFTKVQQIIQEKIILLWLANQYRHKKRCTNCQDHKEMKRLLKQKLKEQLQRTSQTTRNKGSRTVGWGYRDLRSIGKWCSQGRIIYWEHT